MTDPVIKRAQRRDALRLTALMHASRAYGGPYATILTGYSLSTEYVARECVFLAEDADTGALLGFYALLTAVQPPELDLLFVADDAQGQGLGRLLVGHMLQQASQAGLSEVTVVSHPPAEGFYLRAGASRTGTRSADPPAVPWERPELRFTVGTDSRETPARQAAAQQASDHAGNGRQW